VAKRDHIMKEATACRASSTGKEKSPAAALRKNLPAP
jgi:hypothetical protein